MEILGFIAAILTTVSFLPQAIKVIKTRDTKGISLEMYILFVVGVGLWTIYGYLKMDKPVVIANAITFCLASVILYYKFSEKK